MHAASPTDPDAEFVFELQVCRWAELSWPPVGERDSAVVVSRQLGTRSRRWDTVVVECDPEGLASRRAFGDRPLDSDLLHVVRDAPAEWAYYRDALPDPGYPWRYVRAACHRAADRGILETRKREGRVEIRRVRPYPDWVNRLVAVENKPDLDASAASALSDQLAHDVEAALADEVWVATERTGDRVEPVLLEDLPVEVGILTFDLAPGGVDAGAATVDWHASALDPSKSAESIPEERLDKRLEIAERAYGKGWRSYAEMMRPDCRHFELRRAGRALLPYCSAKERCQTAGECSGSCPEFSPEPPQWRTKGWPIEGGPGKGIRRLLERRGSRNRTEE